MSGQPPLEGRESLVLRWMRSAPGRRQRRGALAPSGFAAVAAHRVGLAGLVAWVAWYASLSVAEFPETAFAVLAPHVSRPMLYLLPIWSVVLENALTDDDCRFDCILLSGTSSNDIEWLRDAFSLD